MTLFSDWQDLNKQDFLNVRKGCFVLPLAVCLESGNPPISHTSGRYQDQSLTLGHSSLDAMMITSEDASLPFVRIRLVPLRLLLLEAKEDTAFIRDHPPRVTISLAGPDTQGLPRWS